MDAPFSSSDLDPAQYRYRPGASLATYPTHRAIPKAAAKQHVARSVERLSELQEILYADDRQAVLLIFQGMDAAGKDSTIEHVTSGVNPAGFQVYSFRQPTYKELDHNFLWPFWQALPERGRIGIFNRSYYEEVIVVRVHPEILDERPLAHDVVDDAFWAQRLEDLRHFEDHLSHNGTLVLKFFLNVSRDEQRERLLKRLREPGKLWKFDPRDLDEREHWDAFQHAYQAAIEATHTDRSPWYVIPADHKWTMRAIVAQILCDEIDRLGIPPPRAAESQRAMVEDAIARLERERPVSPPNSGKPPGSD